MSSSPWSSLLPPPAILHAFCTAFVRCRQGWVGLCFSGTSPCSPGAPRRCGIASVIPGQLPRFAGDPVSWCRRPRCPGADAAALIRPRRRCPRESLSSPLPRRRPGEVRCSAYYSLAVVGWALTCTGRRKVAAHFCGTCLAAGRTRPGRPSRARTSGCSSRCSWPRSRSGRPADGRPVPAAAVAAGRGRRRRTPPRPATRRPCLCCSTGKTKLADHVATATCPRSVPPVAPGGPAGGGRVDDRRDGVRRRRGAGPVGRDRAAQGAGDPGRGCGRTGRPAGRHGPDRGGVTAEVLATTATIADRPANREPLALVGRMFGRVAHLLDAVGDLESDRRRGPWNPLTPPRRTLPAARALVERPSTRYRSWTGIGSGAGAAPARPETRTGWPASSPQPVPVQGAGEWGQSQQPGEPKKERWLDDCDCCDCGDWGELLRL